VLTLPSFTFVRARDLAEALDALADGTTLPIAGGTDVVPAMKRGVLAPRRLLSLRRIPELRGIRQEDDGTLVIGAATSLADLSADARVLRTWPAVASAAAAVGSPQIRNAGTVGGNLCLDTRCTFYDQSAFWRGALGHCLKTSGEICQVVARGRRCVAALSADLPPPLIAHGASVRFASARGERTMPLSAFYKPDGAHNTVRQPDEILVDVRLPRPSHGVRGIYVKVRSRASIDFPCLSLAAVVECGSDGVVRGLRLVVGALASTPRVIDGLDAIATGVPLEATVIRRIAERAYASCHPLPNSDVDADWRRAVLPVHVRRALASLAG